jgi:asparagine synthase (glutamine-hydrolysing)
VSLCGIAGFTHKKWSPARQQIEAAVQTLVHRGPDQQGVFRSKGCSLGATRLKILDLQAGDQPIVSADGDTAIVFNGEIYNHLEIRAELESRGHRFHSHTDTETLLHAFLEWDTACLSRLRGMFAIAWWTESRKRLVLARDRVGIKPLYFYRCREDLFFGSELKAILVHPEVERVLSLDGLDCFLSMNYVPCPWTLVEGILKLQPGSWLEWRDGELSCDSYWRLPVNSTRNLDLETAKQELDSLLQDSVREHLLSDVPLGLWLSGGIDSSSILHYATQASSSRLKTFSVSFRGRTFDESHFVQQVVSQYGTDHQELDLNPQQFDLQSAIEEFAYYNDEPDADAGALPLWFLSQLTKRSATVALSGDGADELFGGYVTYRADHLARSMRRLPESARRLALGTVRRWPVSDDKISLEYKAKRFLEGLLLPSSCAHIHWNGTFTKSQKRDLLGVALPGSLDKILAELSLRSVGSTDLSAYLWFDQKYYLPDDILMKVDRMSMAHAVEVRPPFLDHRIIEFAAALPADLKIRGSRLKFVLRELMNDKLPLEVLSRSKNGLDVPTHEWLRGPLRPLLLDTLASGAAEHDGLFNAVAIEACLREHLGRRANLGYHLWGLMILFLWMRKWRIQTAPRALMVQKVPETVLIPT